MHPRRLPPRPKTSPYPKFFHIFARLNSLFHHDLPGIRRLLEIRCDSSPYRRLCHETLADQILNRICNSLESRGRDLLAREAWYRTMVQLNIMEEPGRQEESRPRMREVRRRHNGNNLTISEYASELDIIGVQERQEITELAKEREFRYSIWSTPHPGISAVSLNYGQPGPVVGHLEDNQDGTWTVQNDPGLTKYLNRHDAVVAMLQNSD